MDTLEILKKINFQNHIEKLKTKYKNKKILLGGLNRDFSIITQNYDLSGLNIVGIINFNSSKPLQTLPLSSWGGGISVINAEDIRNTDYDILLLTALNSFEDEKTLYHLNINKYSLFIKIPLNIKMQLCWTGGY